jgi:hypothetical protein
MAIPINNVTRRVVYAASGTGPYAFTFEILAATDIAVYRDDTLLTLTTDYTVTINANGTGSITLTATPTGATQIAIVGNRTIQRLSDFVTGGDFFANTLNDELDQQTIFAQQNAEGLSRALQAPISDPSSINMTLPAAATRATKYLGFDASGNPAALPGTGTASVINLATDVTGVLQPANGGTGSTTSTGTGAVVLASSPTISTLNVDGNLNITGAASKITGDFSGTVATRVMFQTSVTNGNTNMFALPNGTATVSGFAYANNSDITNASYCYVGMNSANSFIDSGRNGVGAYLPFAISVNNAYKLVIATTGNILLNRNVRQTGSANYDGGLYAEGLISNYGIGSHSGVGGAYQNNAINFQWNGSATRLWVDTTDQGSITVSSDYRVKKDVQTQTADALARVSQLRPVTYTYADYEPFSWKADDVLREGFIAHELAEIIPSAVDGEKDEENKIQSLRLDALCSVLVKAIQEQQSIIEQLTQRIAALEGQP